MNKLERDEIIAKAIDKWGDKLQLVMVIEECAELIVAICKYFRGTGTIYKVAEEHADVEITLESVKQIFMKKDKRYEEYIEYMYNQKLDRLKARIGK